MSNATTRETKEVKVGEHVLVLNTYITGRESREIESVAMENLAVSEVEGKPNVTGFDATMLGRRQDLQIKAVVVSVDGKTENIVDLILDLPSQESEEIIQEILEIVEPKKEEAGN